MYKISENEVDFILDDITKRGIVTEDVRDNIVDHVCCIIENEMKMGEDFFKFYGNTIARFFRKELREIEVETRDLLTFKYYYAMKRTLKITGLLSAAFIVLGGLFKLQHWPGAGLLLLAGLLIFSLIFVPLNIILKYQDDKEKKNRIIMIIGFLTTIVGTLGVLFKVMHWPFANILFYGSFITFFLIFIPIYFFTKYKDPETKFNAIIHTTFMIAGCGMLLMLFSMGDSQNIQDSVASMDNFQQQNALNLSENNDALYEEMPEMDKENITKLRSISTKLNSKIEAIKINLIAKSNGVSVEIAANLTSAQLNNTMDAKVVEQHFANGGGDLSYTAFKDAVVAYNQSLVLIKGGTSLMPVQLENLQMTQTVITVVLHELVDIQVQIRSNENSYLSLRKGMLANN
ncbi:MAG: hypothetical protein GQ574_29295 [Crocinitomix sp.]|nr:hypothetical protein [Crocinitomix sp.]